MKEGGEDCGLHFHLLCTTAALLLACEVLVFLFINYYIIYYLLYILLFILLLLFIIAIIYFIEDIKSSSFCVCWYPFDHSLPYVLR